MNRFASLTLGALALAGSATTMSAAEPPKVTGAMFDEWMNELNNWGRWGDDDELGALNLITDKKRKAAAKLVKDGVSVSLAHEALKEKAADNPSPYEHKMVRTGGSDNPGNFVVDTIGVSYHGFAHTHMDSLCHVFYKDRYYNGISRESATEEGCTKLGIQGVHGGVFTRGVLVDVPWVRGVDYLEPGTAVTVEDLDAWEKKAGITVQPGDALLIYTGRWAARAAKGVWSTREHGLSGLHASAIPWLKKRDIAILGSDGGADVYPSGLVDGKGISPIHMFTLVGLGANILDVGDFEALAAEARTRGRWEFLLTFAPLRIGGGTGSPINPIATF